MSTKATAQWIGSRLRDARSGHGLTQKDLAERAHVSQPAIAMWESGQRTPRIDELMQIADALDEDVAAFLPKGREAKPLRAVLRAESVELEQGGLASELERVIDLVEDSPQPSPQISITATEPFGAAEQLLADAAIKEPPVDAERVAHLCGVRVIKHILPDALSGAILETEDGPVIAVNSKQSGGRQRFTVAHELGHHLLRHHDRFHVDLSAHTEVGEPPGYNWMHERQANDFAANLLMPANMVREAAETAESPRALASRFKVSPMAMSYRLTNLGVELDGDD